MKQQKNIEETPQISKVNKHKKEKPKKQIETEIKDDNEDDIEILRRINNKPKREAIIDTDSDEELNVVTEDINEFEINTPEEVNTKLEEVEEVETESQLQDQVTNIKKKSRRRKDKTLPTITSPLQPTTLPKNNKSSTFTCNVCNNTYPTRNQLFIHIKATGHAIVKHM